MVYIREAHAIDSFQPLGGDGNPIIEDPVDLAQRRQVAQQCLSKLALEGIPTLVDSIDDSASRAYDAWPDRLYLVGRSGDVVYQGGPGPDGFLVDELEQAIAEELDR